MKAYVVIHSEIVEKVGLEGAIVFGNILQTYGAYADPKVVDGYNYYPYSIESMLDFLPFFTKNQIENALYLLRGRQIINYFYDDDVIYITRFDKHKDEEQTYTKLTKSRNKGFIYILKCIDKYKLGFSIDVEKRMKQLDTRPFPLELVYKAYSEKAYDIEQELHSVYTSYGYRLEGEWYSSDLPVEKLIYDIDSCIAEKDGTEEAWEAFEKKYKEQEN